MTSPDTPSLTGVGDVVEGPLEVPGELRALQDEGERGHGRAATAARSKRVKDLM